MTSPDDDELLARLRASFEATAARTTIGVSRFYEIAAVPAGKRSHALVISMSAAAAVVVIGGVTAVASSVGSGSSGAPALGIGGSPSVTPSVGAPGTTCVPENYGVIASAAEVAPYTYILPAVPAGYRMYGAWGIIDRHKCAGTTSWNVEYDDAGGYANTDNKAIQLTVTPATATGGIGQALRQELGLPSLEPPVASTPSGSLVASSAPTASPTVAAAGNATGTAAGTSPGSALGSDWTRVQVGAGMGGFADHKVGFGTLIWTNGGLIFQLNAPDPGGDASSLTQLAQSLVHVSPTDPRIKPPADCQVPAGQTCSG